MSSESVVLTFGEDGGSVTITVEPDDPKGWHYRVAIAADGFPFSGTITALMADHYLEAFVLGLRETELPRTVRLGRDRSPELRLVFEKPYDPSATIIGATATLSWTEDDPYPSLCWLIDGIPVASIAEAADRLERILQ